MTDRLNPGEDLRVIGQITSQDGLSTFIMQEEGNLVLYRSDGKARWASGSVGTVGFGTKAVMQTDGNFVLYDSEENVKFETVTAGHPGAFMVVQNDGNVVIYDPSGNALWATNTVIIRQRVAGFLPSSSGFLFDNSFPIGTELLTIKVLGRDIKIGDASNGLCGGMVFAVRDFFEAGIAIPPITTAPTPGPLFDYLVKRLFDSFNIPKGPAIYMHLMNPDLPDHETWFSNIHLAPRGRAWVMINDEWPKIKADLDAGMLSPMGLIKIKSSDPLQMGHNHQVLAYGYDLDGTDLTIHVYDPNNLANNVIYISLSIADPRHTTTVNSSFNSEIYCFFQPDYTFSSPPNDIRNLIQPGGIGSTIPVKIELPEKPELPDHPHRHDGDIWPDGMPPPR